MISEPTQLKILKRIHKNQKIHGDFIHFFIIIMRVEKCSLNVGVYKLF